LVLFFCLVQTAESLGGIRTRTHPWGNCNINPAGKTQGI
jgi:hypothetical protein